MVPQDFVAERALREQANARYGITKALNRVGVDVDSFARSRKVYCPFGYLHMDGGDSPAMRVFEDHAWCFACNKYYTPSRLISEKEDISERMAVESMLLEMGYVPSDAQERWEHAANAEPVVDKAALAQAFNIAAARIISPWEVRQYDADVVQWTRKCLALLDKVETVEQGDTWLDTVKRVLTQQFRKEAS